ncbi:MAG: coproporphyrinogen III oxidase [Alphaproteobacteria bacterium]|nr:coproporphyrinogen III oxidase [Alphaproteobacteria bacterium]
MSQDGQIGIYIHWPFCLSKCPYCDFNSYVCDNMDERAWLGAYLKALEFYAGLVPDRKVVSIFFGGGTPSLMEVETVEAIFSKIQKLWPISNDIEITLEANPTSVETEKFKAFHAVGVNRISLGVQSFSDESLKFLGRKHSVKEAVQAIDVARDIFDHYSFDLIYALPRQTLQNWELELQQALPYLPYMSGHLSVYQLSIERNTPFYAMHTCGKFSLPKEDLAADFYNLTQDILEKADLPAYEVSNHSCVGKESKHNMIYWNYGDYIGVGAGAHGRLMIDGKKYATQEHSSLELWLERVENNGNAAYPFEALSSDDRFLEALMMGLRLRKGVSLETLEYEAQCAWDEKLDMCKIKDLQDQGWLNLDDECLMLEREGLLRLNAVIPYILRV